MNAVCMVGEYAETFLDSKEPVVFVRDGNHIETKTIGEGIRAFGFHSVGTPKIGDAVVIKWPRGLVAYFITEVRQFFGGDNPFWEGKMKCVGIHRQSVKPATQEALRRWEQDYLKHS